MQIDDIDVLKHMRPKDVIVFQDAAKHFNVYIAVRRTNTASLKYIGVAGYVPKRLDCKPKTADQDGIVEGQLRELAGLVVDPTIVGEAAFKPGKYKKAVTEWEKFSHTLLGPPMLDVDGRPAYTYIPPGKFYAVQLDNSHKHYGCLMFSASSLITAGRYIHGDYDLYAIVPASDKTSNVFVSETRLGQPHMRGKELFDVQHYINRRIGAPMILHGDQEKYSDHTDEEIDVFFPDSRVFTCRDKAEIEALYKTEFQGRRTHFKDSPLPSMPAGGLWRRV
jgi:hypothetical protein